MYPDTPNTSRKKVIVIIVLAALAIILLIVVTAFGNSNESATETQQPAQVTGPESESGQDAVEYTGFAELAQRGLTSYQMDGVRYALYQFNKNATTFAVTPSTIKQAPYDRDNPTDFVKLTFTIKVDNTSYQATVDKYTDLSTVRLYLALPDGKAVFDSKPIDSTKLAAPNPYYGD